MTMPRGQYTRKKPDDTAEAPAEETTASADPVPDEPDAAEEQAAGDSAPDTADAPDPDGTATPDDTDAVGKTSPSADSADNVLYPVDDNPAAQPGPLCPACFQLGWPAGAEQTVGCEHGLWIRQWPPAGQGGS